MQGKKGKRDLRGKFSENERKGGLLRKIAFSASVRENSAAIRGKHPIADKRKIPKR